MQQWRWSLQRAGVHSLDMNGAICKAGPHIILLLLFLLLLLLLLLSLTH